VALVEGGLDKWSMLRLCPGNAWASTVGLLARVTFGRVTSIFVTAVTAELGTGLARGAPVIGTTLSADATIAGVTSTSVNMSQDPA
jgi:hypothetical protein